MGTMVKFVAIISIILFFVNCSTIAFKCPYSLSSIYNFGDSLSDTGNLLRRVGPALPSARFPYGQAIGNPTGRFCDGLLMIDYFAKALGLPLLNPYLDSNASFVKGVNFAVAGSTALNFSFFSSRGIVVSLATVPLPNQVAWFKQYLSSINCSSPILDCSKKLRRSLSFLGEIGGNDINYAFTQGKTLQEIYTYIPDITDAIINNAKNIISLGARQMVVPGNFPVGCFPVALILVSNATGQEFDRFGCSRSYNELVIYQNTYLQRALASLRIQFPNVNIIYADYYKAFYSLLIGAPVYGFNTGGSLLRACCGTGGIYNFNGTLTCGSPGITVCPNPENYIHWDGLHPTQEANIRMSEFLIPSVLSKVRCF